MNNTSIGLIGPKSEFEEKEVPGGSFRILENQSVEPFLQTMIAKETAAEEADIAPAAAPPVPAAGDEDVTMAG